MCRRSLYGIVCLGLVVILFAPGEAARRTVRYRSSSSSSSESGLSEVEIAGIVLGSIAFCIIVPCLVVVCLYHCKQKFGKVEDADAPRTGKPVQHGTSVYHM